MSLSEIAAAMDDLQTKVAPPQFVLCGRNVYYNLCLQSGIDLKAPEGKHFLNTVRSKAGLPGTRPATTLFGVKVVLSNDLDPNFWQVLPDPAFVWANQEPSFGGKGSDRCK
jgi:hypothetical protein